MGKPFRFWMTGGVAIMVAAVGGSRADTLEERASARLSRYGVAETVQRIEASAQRHGMHVLACLPRALDAATGESGCVIVLESSQGGTPVLMEREGAAPDLLLSVTLQPARSGGTEVFVREERPGEWTDGLSAELKGDLAELPRLVDEALSG